MSQKQRVLQRLQEGGWLSTVMAVKGDLGEPILRLGAIIWDLKNPTPEEMRRGVQKLNIEERRVEGKTYSEYRLKRAVIVDMPPSRLPEKPKTAQLL